MQQQSGSSSGSQKQQQGSPLDQPGGSPKQEEQTPDKPDEQGGDKPEQRDKEGQGNDPKSPLASNEKDPKNQEGGAPPKLATDRLGSPTDSGDKWGELPVHVRPIFRAEGSSDMPARYRDWIDAYYRRLNRNR